MPKAQKADDPTDEFGTVEIEFKGEVFVVVKDRGEWSTASTLALYEAIASGLNHHWTRYIELALGQAQWSHLLNDVATKKRDLLEFVELFITTTNRECIG